MTVSVITPVLNAADVIGRCVAGTLGEPRNDVEHLVMDAGSTDGTLDKLRAYAGDPRLVVDSRPDRGIYDGMNRGIERARGEWLMFLGADDRLAAPDAPARAVADVDPAQTDLILAVLADESGRRFHSRLDRGMIFRNTVHHQACLYHRRLFEARRFDPAYRVYGDYEFNLHLLCEVRPRVVRRDVLLSIRARRGVSDRPAWRNYREEIAVRHRYFPAWRSLPFDAFSLGRCLAKKTLPRFGGR